MFRKLRIAVLLYVLLFAMASMYLAGARSTDWDSPLWVDVYPVNSDGSEAVQAYIDRLHSTAFVSIEDFFARQAEAYGVHVDRPVRVQLASQVTRPLPSLPESGSVIESVLWSLSMRWYVFKLGFASDRPAPDIVLFAVYHDGSAGIGLERSTALRKGLIAIANVFAARSMSEPNQFVMAHELLHTLGATDKYDPSDNQPRFPSGYADPEREPLYPQSHAELMGGRIPVAPRDARIPAGLHQVKVGPLTATEIGWLPSTTDALQ